VLFVGRVVFLSRSYLLMSMLPELDIRDTIE